MEKLNFSGSRIGNNAGLFVGYVTANVSGFEKEWSRRTGEGRHTKGKCGGRC